VEGFGNVGRGVLNDNLLASTSRVSTILGFLRRCIVGQVMDLGEHRADEGGRVELEVQEGLVMGDGSHIFICFKLGRVA
jgi:hypothetical protein